MSRLSSPTCSELGSPVTQEQDAETPLTPRSKVRAALATLDDSESDTSGVDLPKANRDTRVSAADRDSFLETTATANQKAYGGNIRKASIEDDDDDEDIMIAPKGKLAARLHRNQLTAVRDGSPADGELQDAYRRVRDQLLKRSETEDGESESSLQHVKPNKEVKLTRKLLIRKKNSALREVASDASPSKMSPSNSGSVSPLFKISTESRRRTVHANSDDSIHTTSSPEPLDQGGPRPSNMTKASCDASSSEDNLNGVFGAKQSRLAELVARKKEERRVKEVAERKKREERAVRETISSGASEADSENEGRAGKRLTQLSKPTRKASKRALEEIARENERMKQETQRINRNRQLTHQAVTKKKVTKESLLARFNFVSTTSTKDSDVQIGSSSTQISSTLPSDAEEVRNAQTPSTSPIISGEDRSKNSQAGVFSKRSMTNHAQPVDTSISFLANEEKTKPFVDVSENDLPTLDELIMQPLHQSPCEKGKVVKNRSRKGKGKAIEYESRLVRNDVDDTCYHLQGAQDLISITHDRLDKGKGKAIEALESTGFQSRRKSKTVFTQPPIKLISLMPSAKTGESDSDDLEIVSMGTEPRLPIKSRLEVLNRVPLSKAADQRPLQTLRALAHLTSPSKQKGKSHASMTANEMHQSLQMRARQQAARERAEKIQDARARGVIIQTADERDKDQADLEDLLEKTRREVGELGKKERETAKKEGKTNGEDGLSSSEDEDYKDDEEELQVEVSGSEEDEEVEGEDDDEEDEEENNDQLNSLDKNGQSNMFDEEVSEADSNTESDASEGQAKPLKSDVIETNDSELEGEEPIARTVSKHNRRSKANRVIDEEEEAETETPRKPSLQNPLVPILPGADDSPIGLTQAFAATMEPGDTQILEGEGQNEQQEFLAFVHGRAISNLETTEHVDAGYSMVVDSQAGHDETQGLGLNLDYVQSQVDNSTTRTQSRLPNLATQLSEIPEPSQDVGFQVSSPAPERFVSIPPATAETILLTKGSPVWEQSKKRGRLRRRIEIDDSENAEDEMKACSMPADDFAISVNAFDILKRGVKSVSKETTFDKKTSNAKEMIEEQAQESEDEYAGLGGASDDESGGELDEETKKMMNDDENVNVDERKLAAFYANNARASDEAAVSKLFKDITTGGLRRKRGAGDDLDLSDSEDEKQEARQRARRREFAKMRKALMMDEKLGKMGVDPKKKAFLKAIEDWGADEDEEVAGLLDEPKGLDDVPEESQSQSQNQEPDGAADGDKAVESALTQGAILQKVPVIASSRPPLNPTTTNPRRRPVVDDGLTFKRPSSLLQIRESLSILLDNPSEGFEAPVLSSSPPLPEDIKDDIVLSDVEPPSPTHMAGDSKMDFSHRRNSKPAFIDRLSLKRESSSSLAQTSAANLAFQAPVMAGPKFQPPSLLRRATSQLSAARENEHGISHAAAYEAVEREAGSDKGKIGGFKRSGGSGRTSVNWGGKGVRDGRVEKRGVGNPKRVSGKSVLRGLLGERKDSWE